MFKTHLWQDSVCHKISWYDKINTDWNKDEEVVSGGVDALEENQGVKLTYNRSVLYIFMAMLIGWYVTHDLCTDFMCVSV